MTHDESLYAVPRQMLLKHLTRNTLFNVLENDSVLRQREKTKSLEPATETVIWPGGRYG